MLPSTTGSDKSLILPKPVLDRLRCGWLSICLKFRETRWLTIWDLPRLEIIVVHSFSTETPLGVES